MEFSAELARWQKPESPPLFVEQWDNEIEFVRSAGLWELRVRRLTGRSIAWYIAAVLVLAVPTAWLFGTVVPQTSSRSVWIGVSIAAAWAVFCGVGGMALRRGLRSRQPALIAFDCNTRLVAGAADSRLIGSRVQAVVFRTGRKSDAEHKPGNPIVQVAFLVDRDGATETIPVRTFVRGPSPKLEDRVSAALDGCGIQTVVVRGEPEFVDRALV